MSTPERYIKIKFSSRAYGSTGGLVIAESKYLRSSIADLSRLFPPSQWLKLERLHASPSFSDFKQALDFTFGEQHAKKHKNTK